MGAARDVIQNAMPSRRCWKRAPTRCNSKRMASRGDPLGTASGWMCCAQGSIQVRRRLRRFALSPRRVPRQSGSWRHGGIYGLGSGPRAPRLRTWRGRANSGSARTCAAGANARPPDATRLGGHRYARASRRGPFNSGSGCDASGRAPDAYPGEAGNSVTAASVGVDGGSARRDSKRDAVAQVLEARAHAPQRQACGLQGRPAWNRIGTEVLRARASSSSKAVAARCAEPPTRPQTKRLMAPWRNLWAWVGAARAAVKNVARSRQVWKRAACAPGANALPPRCDPRGRASGRDGCTKGRAPFLNRSRQARLSPRCAPTASNTCPPWRQACGWIGAARGAVQNFSGRAGVGRERRVVANGPDGAPNTNQIDAQRRR
jgi:hypothetical protein